MSKDSNLTWIPVTENLPENRQVVLGYLNKENIGNPSRYELLRYYNEENQKGFFVMPPVLWPNDHAKDDVPLVAFRRKVLAWAPFTEPLVAPGDITH